MSINRTIDELVGRTIATARIAPRASGDAELIVTFTDGSVATVSAWKHGTSSLQMNIDLAPNDRPSHAGEPHREI